MSDSLGRIRACNECRWQKLKCDARDDHSKPCSRCRRMGLLCEVSRTMKKTSRKTKAELARENARLQEQLDSQDQTGNSPTEQSPRSLPRVSRESAGVGGAPIQSPGDQESTNSTFSSQDIEHLRRVNNPRNLSAETGLFSSPMSTLTIDQIGRQKIQDCFTLFFKHYEPFIPGLFDSNTGPEGYFEQSPFLFWTMIATGARSYSDDPIVYERVIRQILRIALGSLFSMTNPIPTIQAVLILCLWPAPINTMFKDPSHALAGAAMQLAVGIGLHVFGNEQDFVRQNIIASGSETSLRFRLWIHCVMIFQSTNLVGGFPYWTIPETNNLDIHLAVDGTLTASLLYRYRLHRIQTDAIDAITKSTQLLQRDCGPPLNSLIELFDNQIRAAVPGSNANIDLLTQECGRLSVKAFHFFAAPDSARAAGLIQLYTIACRVIDLCFNYDASENFARHSTQYYMRMIILAAMSILRISRSQLKDHVDLQHGEQLYFKSITLSRKRSTENNDLDSRNATILTQLWANNDIFRNQDGTLHGDELRLRSRQFISVIFDTFWHWRATFGGWQANPYKETDRIVPNIQHQSFGDFQWNSQQSTLISPQSWTAPVGMDNFSFTNIGADGDIFPDWDWSAGLSFADQPMGIPIQHFDQNVPLELGMP